MEGDDPTGTHFAEDPVLQLDEALAAVEPRYYFVTSYADDADAEVCTNIMAAATSGQQYSSGFQ